MTEQIPDGNNGMGTGIGWVVEPHPYPLGGLGMALHVKEKRGHAPNP
jgi:hypothetical protein